jgi:hypothetical protein
MNRNTRFQRISFQENVVTMNHIISEGIVPLPAIYYDDNAFPAQEVIAA